jgi:hypothetical protein
MRENTRTSAHGNLELITSICMNKYTTQRKMFKLSIIQVCIRYKMGQLATVQSNGYLKGYALWLI